MIDKAHGWGGRGGHTLTCEAGLGYYSLILGPLFCECPHPRALPYT